MSRMDYLILSVLADNEAASVVGAMSVNEILSEINMEYSYNALYKAVKALESEGLVKRGLKDGKSDTFYIKPEGMQKKEELE